MKAIIPAAGLGTRFLPATKAQPKEMLPVLDKPTIQYVVEEALSAGADEVLLVVNDDKPSIGQHFSPNPQLVQRLEQAGKPGYAQAVAAAGAMPVSYVGQPQPLGLGHAVLCAAPQVLAQTPPEPFYVLLGDVLVPDCQMLPRMLAVSRAHHNASVIAVIAVADEEVSRFGIIGGRPLPGADAVWRIERLVEKPAAADAPSNLAVFGRYLLSPRVMQILPEVRPGAANEIQLTDALVGLLAEEEVYALVVGPDEGYDVGTVASWLETNLRLAARDPQLGPLVEAWKSEASAPC